MSSDSTFHLQFNLRALLGLVGLVAIASAIAKYTNVGAAIFWLVLIGVSLSGILDNFANKQFWFCLCVSQVVFTIGLGCTHTTYYTLGGLASVGLWMLMIVHFVPAGLLAAGRLRWAVFVAILILSVNCFSILPQQAKLTYRLRCCKLETQQLILFLDNSKQEAGAYPSDLADYQFQYPSAARLITYRGQPEDYSIYFAISSGASYWYTPSGGWGFYDD